MLIRITWFLTCAFVGLVVSVNSLLLALLIWVFGMPLAFIPASRKPMAERTRIGRCLARTANFVGYTFAVVVILFISASILVAG